MAFDESGGDAGDVTEEMAIDFQELPARLGNALLRNGIGRIGDLRKLTIRQLGPIPGAGKKCLADARRYPYEHQLNRRSFSRSVSEHR